MLVNKLFEARHRLLKRAWVALIEKFNLEHAAAIHVTSSLEAKDLAQFALSLQRVVIIANGVDSVDIAPAREPADDLRALATQQPLILFLGRLSWKKGLDRLLHAFAHTRIGILAIVGTDDENLAPSLSKLANELNIAHRVCFVPRTVTGPDKEFVFSSADVFVLPSYSENFGNTVLEAMQRGLPVIVSRNVGASEAVRASGGGVVVEGDALQLGAAIERLAQNPSLCNLLGARGQRFVSENYSWASMAAQMEVLYESLAAPRQ
jgi:glycosyltransferase involved in cell wall biosynthesis